MKTKLISTVIKISLLFSVFTLSFAGVGIAATEHENAGIVWLNEYLPLLPYNSWTFGDGTTIEVTGTETVNGMLTNKVYRDDIRSSVYYRQDENGTTYYKEELSANNVYGIYNPPMEILPGNSFIAASYNNSSIEDIYEDGNYVTAADVDVKVDVLGFEDVTPATPPLLNGTQFDNFPDCLKLRITLTIDNVESFSETEWFARGIGFVKAASGSGTYELTSASLYYLTGLTGTWQGQIHDSDGLYLGNVTLTVNQNDESVTGWVSVKTNYETYNLPIQKAIVRGPTIYGSASDETYYLEFSVTYNNNDLSGQYYSNFVDYGSLTTTPYVNLDDYYYPNYSAGGGGIFGDIIRSSVIGYHLDGFTAEGVQVYMPVTQGFKALKGAQEYLRGFAPDLVRIVRKLFENLEQKADADKEGFLYHLGTHVFPVLGRIAAVGLEVIGEEKYMHNAYSNTTISVAAFKALEGKGLAIAPKVVRDLAGEPQEKCFTDLFF